MFTNRQVGKTLVNRTQGTKIASEGLKSRVFEVSLADLQSDSDAERSFRKFRLIAEDVQGEYLQFQYIFNKKLFCIRMMRNAQLALTHT